MERFSRIIQLTGNDSFSKISSAKAAVIGLGAVGSFAAEALARCGVSTIIIADFDKIVLSNINRHIGALESTLGMSKTEVIKKRITDINPECRVMDYDLFLHKENFDLVLGSNPDVIIDAIDSLGPKTELLYYAAVKGIETVSSMGAALRTDPFKIKTADISETDICPLARNIRKNLRKRGIEKGITCIYSTEIPVKSGIRPPLNDEKEAFARGRDRNILGSYPVVTAVFGLLAADTALKKLEVL